MFGGEVACCGESRRSGAVPVMAKNWRRVSPVIIVIIVLIVPPQHSEQCGALIGVEDSILVAIEKPEPLHQSCALLSSDFR